MEKKSYLNANDGPPGHKKNQQILGKQNEHCQITGKSYQGLAYKISTACGVCIVQNKPDILELINPILILQIASLFNIMVSCRYFEALCS